MSSKDEPEGDERVRAAAIAAITRDTPKEFWASFLERARQTYRDSYFQIERDPGVLGSQRIDALYQARHFRMEHVLFTLASEHGFHASHTLLVKNGRYVAFVARGALAMTQAYVPAMGEMPKAAKFRERYAAMNRPARDSMLDLGLEPRELLESKDFYGIIAHNPVGRRFEEELQVLGMVQLSIPNPDCSGWLAQFPLQEIMAAYPREDERAPRRELQWRTKEEKKGIKDL